MADAFPQLVRCFESQWAGLTQKERHELTTSWAAPSGRLPSPCLLKAFTGSQLERPIWTVVSSVGCHLTLLSVKRDIVGDLPGTRTP